MSSLQVAVTALHEDLTAIINKLNAIAHGASLAVDDIRA